MASIRELKKEIDWLYSLVLNDCFFLIQSDKVKNKNKIMDLASQVVKKHQEMRYKVNHPKRNGDPGKIKDFYKSLSEELTESVDNFLEKLANNIK